MFALKCGRMAGRTLQCCLIATFSHNFEVLMGTATASSALTESKCARSHHQAQIRLRNLRAFQAVCSPATEHTCPTWIYGMEPTTPTLLLRRLLPPGLRALLHLRLAPHSSTVITKPVLSVPVLLLYRLPPISL